LWCIHITIVAVETNFVCWDTHYCQLYNSIDCFTAMRLWQIYVPGKNRTYVRFHVKCTLTHTHTYTHILWHMKLVIFSPLFYAGKWLLRCRWLADSGLQWGMYTRVTFLLLTCQCYMNRWLIWGRCYVCMLFCLGFGLSLCVT
jgi:hypothetical protein